jgi:hypothetical protein
LADSPPPPGLSTSSDISDLRTPRRPFFKMLGSWECQALNRTKLMPASSKSQEFRWWWCENEVESLVLHSQGEAGWSTEVEALKGNKKQARLLCC